MAKANVATKEESQLPALSLDLMEGDAHSGLENISQDDLATQRLKVLMKLYHLVNNQENSLLLLEVKKEVLQYKKMKLLNVIVKKI